MGTQAVAAGTGSEPGAFQQLGLGREPGLGGIPHLLAWAVAAVPHPLQWQGFAEAATTPNPSTLPVA